MKDIYVQFDGPLVKGESQDKDHAEWIEAMAFEHTLEQPKSAKASTAGGHTSERTTHGDVFFAKEEDVTSPLLAQYCSGGQTFDAVTIQFYRADGQGNRVMYKEIQLKHVIISRITSKISGDGVVMEGLTLKYAAIQWKHTKQKIGGNQAGVTQGAWSLVKNDKTFSV
ncbi:MAG: type VI secretion system tube protein Hcp [Burkholderiales bacterium]|jgi:type VI secretion system secreted protein Hcp|nr:type VI secretion system tube protein Hcp [Burkholderiales bacterium]